MAAVLTRNPDAEEKIVDPVKADGSRYRYEMIFEGGRSRAYADTAIELVDALVPGYEAMDEEGRTRARVSYASSLLAPVQATVLQRVDQTAIPEAEKRVLLQPRFEPVVVEEWSSEVPLVLLDVHYQPYSDIAAPVSTLESGGDPRNLIWLRAADDLSLVLSLDRAGLISLGESTDFAV